MTPQEIDRIERAIRHIESSLDVDPWAAQIAVDAMRKQIPKKPVIGPVIGYVSPYNLRGVLMRTDPQIVESKIECCPVCGRTLGVNQFVKSQTGLRVGDPYCKRCGQAIDWEGEG